MTVAPPLVKVCGVTNVADAVAVAAAGADWVGLNFHPASPRFVTAEAAATILAALPTTARSVAVLDRTRAGRTFRRLQGTALTALLDPPLAAIEDAAAVPAEVEEPPGGQPETLPPVE